MKIIISPYSKPMRNGKENAKNYPYWNEVIKMLLDANHEVTQLQFVGEKTIDVCREFVHYSTLSIVELLIDEYDAYVSVDNFLQHIAHYRKKYGVVIWGKSDPELFGYSENVNLLKDRKFLRIHQFETWEAEPFDPLVFVTPQIVVKAVEKIAVSKK
jgi:ADP-heptose:LPS heptosyltransferase